MHTQLVQAFNNLFTEQCAVHAQLNFHCRTGIFYLLYTVLDEIPCASTIENIADMIVNSQHLRVLRNSAVQGVVAALAFFFLLDPLAIRCARWQVTNTEPFIFNVIVASGSRICVSKTICCKRSMTRRLRSSTAPSCRLLVDTGDIHVNLSERSTI